ncbi:SDR family NAD(P)-dependent oxidoreductase [Amycolatopsis jiangsuensis]|uniref:NAD(P)-dependent dehydrogenase (Short-subunit alcohol dehydrogenase family) n=1 Tax=Amycolatopsis jiangsuensis TaxID=1181879 RepID=A0A840ITK0_9PSEU|nr:SDR family oxidoreductase [Amycolatopsis jiangsuensis]MBB4684304.1 NAD(P)-dependent dehydrogenase (short-subunit alcohol dehydrogenase family) [Amycolatopsis jiangsuensis]
MAVLTGKVAVVTGGSSGIGLAIARSFRDEGAKVFITGRRKEALDAAVAELGENVTAVVADSAVPADLDALYETVREQAGHLDIVVANAGIGTQTQFGAVTEEQIDEQFAVNVKGTIFTVQKALPLLRSGASLVLIGSSAATSPSPGLEVYGATKAAIRNLARGWAHSSLQHGFRVNVLSPGAVPTPGLLDLVPAEVREQIKTTVPLGRLGTPEELAAAATFLASDASSYMNGAELVVDGGVTQI